MSAPLEDRTFEGQAAARGGASVGAGGENRPQIPLVLSAVFLFYLGQQALNPIIAPVAREVGLAEWQVGVTISAAAVMVVLTSQFWGRKAASWGRRPVLITAMSIGTACMALFACTAWLGTRGVVTGIVLFALFLLFRGIGFGGAMAMVPPTVQAYIVNVTTDRQSRVKGMAGVGAMQAFAMIAGSTVGGLLAVFGLFVPLVAIPCILAVGLLLIVARLRRESGGELVEAPRSVHPLDPGVFPYLLAGFGVYTAMGLVNVTIGFLVQDRLGLGGELTGLHTGGVLLASGAGMVLVQSFLVPKVEWAPGRLLRVGAALAALGCGALVVAGAAVWLYAAMFLFGVGLGVAMPGYTAGPTMEVEPSEQGGLAGLIGATNGLTYVVAPVLGTALYGVAPVAPAATGCAVLMAVVALVLVHPRFRNAVTETG